MAQFTAASIFDSALTDAADSINRTKKSIAIIRTNNSRIEKLLRPVSLIISGAGLTNNSAYVSADDFSETFTVAVYLYGLESFKVPALGALIEYFDGMSEGVNTRDWPDSINRDYHFKLPKGNKVILGAYVKDDSPTCRKVPIGSETKQVIKYEIQCD